MQNQDELEYLADHLAHYPERKAPDHHFTLNAWFLSAHNVDEHTQRSYRFIPPDHPPITSGVFCCAIGEHILTTPTTGLQLRAQNADPQNIPTPYYQTPNGLEHWSYQAIAAYFAISIGDALWLFSSQSYHDSDHNNPAAVAQRIRQLIG